MVLFALTSLIFYLLSFMVDEYLGGFMAKTGYYPRSTTSPNIGPLSSASRYTAAAAIFSGNMIRPEGAYMFGRSLYQSGDNL
jgi:hypothetical protein